MNRLAIAALVVAFARLAHADSPATPAAAKEPNPDEIADVESREANLESKESRKGFTFALALGGGLSRLGGDVGIASGAAFSARIGHVATRKTIITFELNRFDGRHKAALMGPTLYDSSYGLFAGAQRYKTGLPVWVRAAGGLAIFVANADAKGAGGDKPIPGVGGLVGGGFDIVRIANLVVIGFEVNGVASVSGDGLKVGGNLNLGFSIY